VQASAAPVSGILDVGRYPEGVDEVSKAVAAALSASRFDSLATPRVMRAKYSKLLMNLANAIEAACGSAARASGLAPRARAEGEAVLRAAGIDFASPAEDAARRGDTLRIRPIDGQRRGGGSSWQSLARGAGSIEADYLNGEIVLLGRTEGVATPVNAMLQRVANRLAAAHATPGSLTVPELEALV
jgi:2-dehydropantoate 2-reductase